VRAESGSEPQFASLSEKAAIISPVASFGRYFCFCSGVPKNRMGSVPMPTCAPHETANDACRLIFSAISVLVVLGRFSPPKASGKSAPSKPSCPAFLSRLTVSPSS
jgi:hypothetical protein